MVTATVSAAIIAALIAAAGSALASILGGKTVKRAKEECERLVLDLKSALVVAQTRIIALEREFEDRIRRLEEKIAG